MNAADRREAVRFATAYGAYHSAAEKGDMDSMRVWRDLLVESADRMGLLDSELFGLADKRAEKKADEDRFMAAYRAFSEVEAA